MAASEPTVTYLELRESAPDGTPAAGLSHTSKGLVLLHVQELAADGEPRGTATIVHDAGGHGGQYLELGRRLAAAGWAVALPDLRGHGRSEGPRGHSNGVREVVRDLGDVQDHLAYRLPEAPKVLVGQGLGALWCLAYASEHPGGVAALVLAAPLVDPRFALPDAPGGLKGLFKKARPDDAGRIGWDAAPRGVDRAEPAHDVITRRAGEEAAAAARHGLPKLGRLGLPVLVLVGAEDPIAPPESVLALAGGGVEVRTLEGVGHDVFHGAHAGGTADALVRWLDAHAAG